MIRKLNIPKLEDVIRKLKKIEYRRKMSDYQENSRTKGSVRSSSKTRSLSGPNFKRNSRSTSKLNYGKRKGYVIPALELRKMIEIMDKK